MYLNYIFIITECFLKTAYFIIFHLDIQNESKPYLPLYNFLKETTKLVKKFKNHAHFSVMESAIKLENLIYTQSIEQFLELMQLLENCIIIDDFSLENMVWVNFILELEVKYIKKY